MKSKILLFTLFLLGITFELLAQAARNIPRDAGPVEWTIGNILTFIVFPVCLIIFLFFYIKRITREKKEEEEEKEKNKNKEQQEDDRPESD